MSKVITLEKDWYAKEREPSDELQIRGRVKTAPLSKTWHTVRAVADRFGVSDDMIYELIKSCELDAQPFGRIMRISEEALTEYCRRQREKRGRAG
jgi:excisionase family DNA binding protein